MKDNSKSLLSVQNLRVSFATYSGEVQAVRNVGFCLDKKETLAIVGESGCGKTVTAQAIMQLIPIPPGKILSGKIMFEGENILDYSDKKMEKIRGKEISMIFQDPITFLNPTMKIGQQIQEVLKKHRNMNNKEAYKNAVHMLETVGISDPKKRAGQYPHEFSGGMRQRVMIAIALACKPKILIADEPTTALDVTVQAQIMELIKELQKKYNTGTILITHDLGIVAGHADKIAVMYAGIIVEYGTTEDIFYNSKHPYTWGLMLSLPRIDIEFTQRLITIEGTPPDLISPPSGCPFGPRCEYRMKICDKYMPDILDITQEHYVRCWLTHENAPKIESPLYSGRGL